MAFPLVKRRYDDEGLSLLSEQRLRLLGHIRVLGYTKRIPIDKMYLSYLMELRDELQRNRDEEDARRRTQEDHAG